MEDPCLSTIDLESALQNANRILSNVDGTQVNTLNASTVQAVLDGDTKQISFKVDGSPWKPKLPPTEWLFMWGTRPGMEPKVCAVCKVPFEDFDDPTLVTGGRTEIAKAIAELYKVFGPDGTAIRFISTDSVFQSIAKSVNNPKLKKLLPGKKAKVTEESRCNAFSEDMMDAMEGGKTEVIFKPCIKFRTDKKTGEQSVQLILEQKIFEPAKQPRTESETEQMLSRVNPGSELAEWIKENPNFVFKKTMNRTFSTRFSSDAEWFDLFRAADKYSSVRAVCQATLFPFRLQVSKAYERIVFTMLIEDMNTFSVTTSSSKKRKNMGDFESACWDQLLANKKPKEESPAGSDCDQ